MEKLIKDFEDYIINDSGINEKTVWSTKTNKWLKPAIASNGYYTVSLCKNGVPQTRTIHSLIGEAFIPNPNNYSEIDHINTIRTDNRVENLKWTDRQGNCNNETTIQHYNEMNERKKKKVYQYTLDGELIDVYPSIHAVENNSYNCKNVSKCCRGLRNTAYGYKWYFNPL